MGAKLGDIMKKSICIFALFVTFVLIGNASAQTSGVLWIKTFQPGSTSLVEKSIDRESLAALDELMKDPSIEVTFLGSADSTGWVMNGKSVHTNISEAWNDAKRLGRARALRGRYQRGQVGVTHENIAGVKVVWSRKASPENYKKELSRIKQQNLKLNEALAKLAHDFQNMQPMIETQVETEARNFFVKQNNSQFDWFLQGGFWTWQSGSGQGLISPSMALGIIINKTSFILQGGVTPWNISTTEGNQSESFVYVGLKHMKTKKFGVSAGVFRGWEFYTSSDNWSFKTTGLSAGVVIKKGIIEFNPMLSYSNSNSIFETPKWKLGTTLGLSINVNEAF